MFRKITCMKTTLGVFENHTVAEHALNELRAFGVAEADLSYVFMNVQGEVVDSQTNGKVNQGSSSGAMTGAVVGALAGLVAANIILPGVGTLFVAGPLAAMLGVTGTVATAVAGATVGVVTGGLIGALVNFGVSDTDASFFEVLVHQGDVLIVARTPALNTREVFERSGAKEIREYSQ